MDPTTETNRRTPSKPYPAELRERSVRMFFDHRASYRTETEALESIANKMGMHRDTLKAWVRRAEIDGGQRPGLTTDERERLKQLERENKELRRANAILKDASVFFATERVPRTSRRRDVVDQAN
jgi:transposase